MTTTADTIAPTASPEFGSGSSAQAGAVSEHQGACACSCCNFQSPFNIRSAKTTKLPDDIAVSLHFEEQKCLPKKIDKPNPRHNTVQVDAEPDTSSEFRMQRMDETTGKPLNEYRAKLTQFHTHVKAEHLIDGKRREGELHFVYKDEAGDITVVAVTVKEGRKRNTALEGLLNNMGSPTQSQSLISKAGRFIKQFVLGVDPKPQATLPDPTCDIGFSHLVPKRGEFFMTKGSLTTPGDDNEFKEGVRWVVFKEPITATPDQIERFTQVIGSENYRQEQPVQDRLIYRGVINKVTVHESILRDTKAFALSDTIAVNRDQFAALPAEYRSRLMQEAPATRGKG